MFRHTDYLQFDAKPERPDPVYAHKLQELKQGEPSGPALGTETGLAGKIKDALT